MTFLTIGELCMYSGAGCLRKGVDQLPTCSRVAFTDSCREPVLSLAIRPVAGRAMQRSTDPIDGLRARRTPERRKARSQKRWCANLCEAQCELPQRPSPPRGASAAVLSLER
jgi:hypothetical protein